MIIQLHIKNFLLIEESVIQFDEGFNVITGESGSGKSLILKAIRFCLGQKVNKSFVGHWGTQAVVRMELQGDWPKDLLPELKSDSGRYIIQRVLREKSSQCFINDQKVSLASLSEIAPYLLLDCEQSQSIKLLNQDFQATVIDQKVNHDTLRAYFDARREYQLLKARQKEITSLLTTGDDESFIESQVSAFNSLPEETYEALQEDLLRFKSLQALSERWDQDSQIFRQLYKCCGALKALDVNEPLAEEVDSLETALTGVEREITHCLEQHADSLFELSDIKEKISRYNDMGRKHRCLPKDLQSIHESLQSQLLQISQAREEQESIIDEVKKAETIYAHAAAEVMMARKSQSDTLSEIINRNLVLLGMDQAIFRVNWQESTPCFEVQSNPGQLFKPIGECLSGGELSRLNLLILLYLGDSRAWILDEIDTGVSGVTGFKIRSLIAQIAQTRQVICISHLAQVSAGASTHFVVDKNITIDKMVKSEIIKLSGQDRLKELARLMCGIVDQETVENAKQLID